MVKEPKANCRTLRHAAELGLRQQIPEDHDVLAWLVRQAAPPFCTNGVVDPCRSTRPGSARKVGGMRASSWGVFGAGVGSSDYGIGTPGRVKAGDQAGALSVKELPWNRRWAHFLQSQGRRVNIRREVGIGQYGATLRCARCTAIAAGTVVQPHSTESTTRSSCVMVPKEGERWNSSSLTG